MLPIIPHPELLLPAVNLCLTLSPSTAAPILRTHPRRPLCALGDIPDPIITSTHIPILHSLLTRNSQPDNPLGPLLRGGQPRKSLRDLDLVVATILLLGFDSLGVGFLWDLRGWLPASFLAYRCRCRCRPP